ncbi:MAG TPA: DNA repair protein RecN [Bdellovibrionota bacterium]|jgi:DNA repair protein RecN (Recombination protein N)
MLKRLRIQNFAIIDEVAIDFGHGLNIISGETGAGKSILMDALALILGGRASSDLIRSGADEASVEALFEIPADSDVHEALEAQGMNTEDGDLIIRRIVHRSGKNRIFVNGHMANMAALQAVTSSLVDLCSQHDQQLLSRTEEQLLWVDRFGGLESERAEIKALYLDWKDKACALEALSTDSAQRAQRIDFLRFQIQELEDASLSSASEDGEIEQELKTLGNAENLFAFAAEAEGVVFGTDSSDTPPMLDSIGALLNKVKGLASSDPKLGQAIEHLSSLKLHADELGFFLRSYSQGLSRNEERLEDLNARHALLTKLKRKYGPALSDAISNLSSFQKELSLLENHDSSLTEARAAVELSMARLRKASEKLSSVRLKKAREFSQAVVRELGELHMDRARFEASLVKIDEPNISGLDSVRFEIAANPGEPMGPMNKVASGGELSRIMLAMHNVVSSRGNVGVFLFDEVDTGIGGATAVAVGSKLRKVAAHNQVICITHLPQVASFGQTHLRVDKSVEKKGREERTICRVILLSEDERELEIARMLGGMGNHKAALANARAMLEMAESKSGRDKPAARLKKPETKARLEATRKN